MIIDYALIGKRIKEARKRNGLSQAELAEKIDLSTTYVSYIENGYKCMSLNTLIFTANTLCVSSDELLQDALKNTTKVSNHEFASLLSDCNEYEIRVLLDIVKNSKAAMRQYYHILKSMNR